MKAICPDCHVKVGQKHQDGCDIETCAECGTQRVSCKCHSVDRIPWEGCDERPYAVAAEENGWYAYWDPSGAGKPEENYGWVSCDKNHPMGGLDLNRVVAECEWNKQTRKWVKKEQ